MYFVKSTMKKKGYTLLSDSYINAHTSLQCLCPYDHIYEVTWGNWKAGNRCPYCATNAKLTIDFVKSSFESEGYILLTKKFLPISNVFLLLNLFHNFYKVFSLCLFQLFFFTMPAILLAVMYLFFTVPLLNSSNNHR